MLTFLELLSIILLTLFLVFFFYYLNTKKYGKKRNFILNKKRRDLKLLTLNVKRLPYTNKKLVLDFKDFDIICLQEYFEDFKFNKSKSLKNNSKYNYIVPPSNLNNLIDSGLTILSRYPMKYIGFEAFKNSCSVDRLAQKGFMIVRIRKIYIINTHLQSCYNKSKKHKSVQYLQLEQIKDYIIENFTIEDNIVILGDFNINLFNDSLMNIFEDFINIYSKAPTIWDDEIGIFSNTNKYKVYDNMIPKWLDGALIRCNNIIINNVQVEDIDDNTDHLGLSFKIIKN